ncbi:GAF and ANTAR domain-containing protein [Pseudarthrobacter oxydans]|uniref:GAF and ANTAR domain-containing protein n=1 Tax=Pseudarthrobacter oxydans TaxID=1671 RepID=UPI0027D7EEDC|nr:GAF and ANTAR domain-containing protein [Pseudarthrobacter oxydans]
MVSGTGASPTPEQLQDLLLESPGFTEFLLGLTTVSATLLGGPEPMLCAITVERNGSPATVASSGEEAKRLDEKQYTFDDGPCLTALRQGITVLVPDVAADDRWAHYASTVSGEGIRSVLAVPIATDPGSAAALNCYARTSGVFDSETVAEVERHAASISRILRLALKVHPPEIYPENLRSALKSRAIIDAAVALIMIQNRCSREQSMELLHLAARATDTKLHTIATDILQGASLPSADPPE